MHRLLVAIALLGACGGGKDEKKGAAPSGEEPRKPPPPATNKPPADMFTGTTVALPAPIDKLGLEMDLKTAREAVPAVFEAKYGYEPPGFDKVKLHVQVEGGRVYSIRAEIAEPVAIVKGWLAKKWGEPKPAGKALVWNAPAVGLRAKLEPGLGEKSNLYYAQVQSLEQLLGTEPKRFGFEKGPLIGAKRDEAMKALAAYRPTPRQQDPDSITMSLPAIEASEHTSSLDLRVKEGIVTGFTLTINFGDDQAVNAAIAKRLDEMFGKGVADDTYVTYPGPPPAKAELRAHGTRNQDVGFPDVVWVGDYRK